MVDFEGLISGISQRLQPEVVFATLSVLIPLSVLGVFAYAHWVVPTPPRAGASYDPKMAYLLNSLAPLKSRPYMYYHHLSTSLSILGTAVLIPQNRVGAIASDGLIIRLMGNSSGFFILVHGVLTRAGAMTVHSTPHPIVGVWRTFTLLRTAIRQHLYRACISVGSRLAMRKGLLV